VQLDYGVSRVGYVKWGLIEWVAVCAGVSDIKGRLNGVHSVSLTIINRTPNYIPHINIPHANIPHIDIHYMQYPGIIKAGSL